MPWDPWKVRPPKARGMVVLAGKERVRGRGNDDGDGWILLRCLLRCRAEHKVARTVRRDRTVVPSLRGEGCWRHYVHHEVVPTVPGGRTVIVGR